MKGKGIFKVICTCALCAAVLCTGCGAGSKEPGAIEGEPSAGNTDDRVYIGHGTDGAEGSKALPELESVPESGAGGTEADGELTKEELRAFTDFANQLENNGFLQSQYDTVSAADLNQILYNGAGMESQPLSEEERRAYEAAAYPVETDITRLTAEQIEGFLRRKAGIGLADMEGGLDWVYLEASDCYVSQHGDTNFCTFVCTGGKRTGDAYELRFKAGAEYVSDCVTVLKRNGDDYQFVSNRYFHNADDRMQTRKIEDQSFSVELDGWGEVEFVSYGPDILEDFRQDATFRLEREGQEAFRFPEVRDGNLRTDDRFERIDAVSFTDYDKDGCTDILIICTYERIDGEDAGTRHQEVRIYKAGEGTFRYMSQLCFNLNTQGKNQSISQVLEEIGEEALDLSGLDEGVAEQLEIFAKAKEQWVPRDYDPFAFGFTVHDLDGDGRLELLVQVVAGTGLYSENHFYQVNDSGDGIKELPQELYDGAAELDIGVTGSQEQAFQDRDGAIYYMASDITRNGYAESFRQDGAYCLRDGCVYSVSYRGLHMQAVGEDSREETYYDADGNEISQEDWEGLRESFLAGKTEIPYGIVWADSYPEDALKASVQEILKRLAECAEGM